MTKRMIDANKVEQVRSDMLRAMDGHRQLDHCRKHWAKSLEYVIANATAQPSLDPFHCDRCGKVLSSRLSDNYCKECNATPPAPTEPTMTMGEHQTAMRKQYVTAFNAGINSKYPPKREPTVPLSVVDEFIAKYPEYLWHNKELNKVLAPYRDSPAPDADEPCKACDDYTNGERCPDCAPATPATPADEPVTVPTTAEKAAWWRTLKKTSPGYLEGVGGLAVALCGEEDDRVRQWLRDKGGGQ